MIKFENTEKFDKDFKRLLKNYRSLNEDFKLFKTILPTHHDNTCPNLSYVFEINNLKGISREKIKFFKVKKFACKALKGSGGNTKLRIIYAYIEEESKIFFLEFYFKGKNEKEDRDRIIDFYKKHSN